VLLLCGYIERQITSVLDGCNLSCLVLSCLVLLSCPRHLGLITLHRNSQKATRPTQLLESPTKTTSDLRSQAGLGPISSALRNHVRTPGGALYCPYFPFPLLTYCPVPLSLMFCHLPIQALSLPLLPSPTSSLVKVLVFCHIPWKPFPSLAVFLSLQSSGRKVLVCCMLECPFFQPEVAWTDATCRLLLSSLRLLPLCAQHVGGPGDLGCMLP